MTIEETHITEETEEPIILLFKHLVKATNFLQSYAAQKQHIARPDE
jgi:hypothetical protein